MQLGVEAPGITALFAFLTLVSAGGFVVVGYWLYHDARARGSKRPAEWVANWLLFHWFAVGYYLWVRDRIGERTAPVTARERGAATLALGLLFALLADTALTSPDPFTQLVALPLALLVTLPLAYTTFLVVERVRVEAA